MNSNDLIQYCSKKTGARMEFPFGLIPICFKICNRLFLELYPSEDDTKITVRCDPVLAEAYRQQYPGIVTAGYHCPACQKPYKNTVCINRGLPDDLIYQMIDMSYHEAVKSLRKADRDELDKLM